MSHSPLPTPKETLLLERRYYRDEIKAARARRFAAQLVDTLYELGITHKRLARELGVSVHTVDAWTRAVDPNVPGQPNLDRLCALLERRQPGAGVQVAKAMGHKWEPTTAPTDEPVQPRPLAGPAPTNLPIELSSFIGREQQMAQAARLLKQAQTRLLTLTGPGGTGKTRLALHLAAEMLGEGECANGVWLVELAALTDHHLVLSAVANVLGVKESGGQPLLQTLKEALRDKEMLLVLDNFEQVAQAAPVVADLLKAAPKTRMLVTSRVSLHLYGEKEFPIPPLSLPPIGERQGQGQGQPAPLPLEILTQYEAVRLFIERAQDVRPDFQVTNDNAPAVAEICARLDGLPLAIELAAAHIRLFPPQALLARLSDRLKLLTGGARDLPARQQTLRNTIEWSYDLLSEGEKQLFRRMAVFQGGRTLEALEAVCNSPEFAKDGQLQVDVLEGVEALVSQSLLQPREGSDGEPRFWMLETIHEYVREKLKESEEAQALQREHAQYFTKLVEQAEPELTGARQQEWLNRLEDDHDNIRAALRWARENGSPDSAEIGLRLAGVLWRFWFIRGYRSEGREQLAIALEGWKVGRLERLNASYARALNGAGVLAWMHVDYDAARSLQEQSLAIRRELGDKESIAGSLAGLGIVAYLQGNYSSARSLHEESLAIWRELGDKQGIAHALVNLGNTVFYQGDYASARSLHEQSLAIRRELGDKQGIAGSLTGLGNTAFNQGDYSLARTFYEESLAIWRELGNWNGIATSLSNLGNVVDNQGEHSAARSLYEESLAIYRELGEKGNIAWLLTNMGKIAYRERDIGRARALYKESLAIAREIGDKPRIATCLVGLAGVASQQGQDEQGVGGYLLGAGEGLLETMGAVMDRGEQEIYEDAKVRLRALLGEEAFERARQAGRAMSLNQAISLALGSTVDD